MKVSPKLCHLFRLALALACCLHISHAACSNLPIRLQGETLTSQPSSGSCPTESEKEMARRRLDAVLNMTIEEHLPLFRSLSSPAQCPGTGWVKVVDFNLEKSNNVECPGPEWFAPAPVGDDPFVPHCEVAGDRVCESAHIFTHSASYTEVCGRIKGYQIGVGTGFFPSTDNSIEGTYLDGVSLTHGSPGNRMHIWSFAVGSDAQDRRCPCSHQDAPAPPAVVGQDYFCNTGAPGEPRFRTLYTENPLWDGEGCVHDVGCCARGPYFHATLANRTCDDLEVRLCTSGESDGLNVGVSIIELYVR